MSRASFVRLGALIGALVLPAAARATIAPSEIEVSERLGAQIPLELPFTTQDGQPVRLGDVLATDAPTILVMAYYHCPMLCGLVLRGLATGLGKLDWQIGGDYRVVSVSFDPKDSPYAAKQSQAATLAALAKAGEKESRDGSQWPFLVGPAESSQALMQALGFRAIYDQRSGDWAHPAVAFVLTPEGKVARYLYGIEFSPRDLKLALFEASQGKLGSTLERVILRCYVFDPATRKYGLLINRIFRVGGVVILLAVGLTVGGYFYRERKERRA